MANIPPYVASELQAEGIVNPVSLLELQTVAGQRVYLADAPIPVPSLLSRFDPPGAMLNVPWNPGFAVPPGSVAFMPWLIDAPQFTFTASLATITANATFQNLSGNTVQRDGSLLFNSQELWGALFVYRLWLAASEYALVTVVGNVSDAEADEEKIALSLRGFSNWSEIKAPDCTIGVNCGNVFGSQQCGSTSPTPCQNTYGSCSQLNRFKGLVTQWDSQITSVPPTGLGTAQPIPNVQINLRRPA